MTVPGQAAGNGAESQGRLESPQAGGEGWGRARRAEEEAGDLGRVLSDGGGPAFSGHRASKAARVWVPVCSGKRGGLSVWKAAHGRAAACVLVLDEVC